ncbi:DUF4245 domain-containing protein [Blastococcus haudaquaticus]|uniref:DUF4245 domain-containing protein n=1 Tax=Blastococcus haudaquaticus TaxID=1938745 RepID=A0A286H1N5_9ACTN|nr:DUF4245 domain-containing protein [Blastococcus haudaquaticus]SOE01224.1 Protein of unknown function [Blastococcus haudaquaticus]
MTGVGPSSEHAPTPAEQTPAVSPAIERANRMSAANMLRSLLPLVVICLLIVGWQAFRSSGDVGVRTVDPSSSVQLAAARADYPLLVPTGLDDEEYRPTSARTDAGAAGEGDPVTLEIGYLTPSEEFAGFVVSDDRGADPVTAVLGGATEQGTVEIGGERWTRSTTADDETALSLEADGVTVLVTGSAPDEELEAVAAAVEPYAP